jgi:hypothetical protein
MCAIQASGRHRLEDLGPRPALAKKKKIISETLSEK